MTDEVSAGLVLFNQAAENNKAAIFSELNPRLPEASAVLEIGSGSGQHALHFAAQRPDVQWQPMDRPPYFDALCRNIAVAGFANIMTPLPLDAVNLVVPQHYDAAYCANVFHIMPESLLQPMVASVAAILKRGGRFYVYGPWRYEGRFTTASNLQFDAWLKDRDAQSGIRDIETLQQAAAEQGMTLLQDIDMPANNQFLVLGFTA